MRILLLVTVLLGAAPALLASAPALTASLKARPTRLAYQQMSADGLEPVRVYNFTDAEKGFVLYSGEEIVGYSPDGVFDEATAAPAMLAMLEAMVAAPAATEDVEDAEWTAVAPLRNESGYVMWNQDSPFNDLCPDYGIGSRCPTGCVATAMAQVMFYHNWPERGSGSHTYSPAILHGNTLTADFGNTEYNWDAMIPNYTQGLPGADNEESRAAVAELMLHCGIAVDMVYYTQSGATDYDVAPALVDYFNYDRSLAYRKREHYNTTEWLRIINNDLLAGYPVLAYGKSSSGGHAYVFDGMDSNGFIHVNWGWGGMSNGYFNTSALTPPMQGIGGADGGFNYSQRIITGIRPADAQPGDYHVEITSTEGLSAGRRKIEQEGEVRIKLSGKVYNHGWRDAEFDYALLLADSEGNIVNVFKGPEGNFLAMNANAYAPDFGNISLGRLEAGEYSLIPAVRSMGGEGEWIPVRDEYIGYPNILKVTATDEAISFSSYDYFDLAATALDIPEVIWAGLPTLMETKIVNNGDAEYHGEIRAVIFSGNNAVASTSNYLIDLAPGKSTSIRFTDAFDIAAGEYTLALLNDDGQKISSPVAVTVKEVTDLGNVSSVVKAAVVDSDSDNLTVKAVVTADSMFQGLLYAFVFDANGNAELGCLYPEFISLSGSDELEVTLSGVFENGIPGNEYQLCLAVYSRNAYTMLNDENSTVNFTLGGEMAVGSISGEDSGEYRYYDFNGFEVDPRNTKLVKKVKVVRK